jgi:CNT family concentrative nucleoside transporter
LAAWQQWQARVLAGYVLLGVELRYLLAASFMAAPGGFLMAKMMIP